MFAFGDAGFFGSLGGAPPSTALVGVAPTPDGGGYWVLGANGTVYAFGDAPPVALAAGSPALATMKSPMTGLIPDFSGQGFDAVNGSGQAFAYGDAPYFGDVTTAVPRLRGPCRRHRRHAGLTRPVGHGRPPRRAGGTGAGARAGPGARRPHRGPPR